MQSQEAEHIFSLYTDDDDVLLYETLSAANAAKSRRESFVEVKGPFAHPRHELPLLRAVALAARDLRRLAPTASGANANELARIASELEAAARAVYPLKRIPLASGGSIDLHPNASDDPRE